MDKKLTDKRLALRKCVQDIIYISHINQLNNKVLMPSAALFQTQNIDVQNEKTETEVFHLRLYVFSKITHQEIRKQSIQFQWSSNVHVQMRLYFSQNINKTTTCLH